MISSLHRIDKPTPPVAISAQGHSTPVFRPHPPSRPVRLCPSSHPPGGNATVVVSMSDREVSAIGLSTREAVSPSSPAKGNARATEAGREPERQRNMWNMSSWCPDRRWRRSDATRRTGERLDGYLVSAGPEEDIFYSITISM